MSEETEEVSPSAPQPEEAPAVPAPLPPRAERVPIPPDTIFIGRKPVMAYVTAVLMHFESGANELTVKARGRAISRAVDVVEVVSRRFLAGKLNIKDISIGTETLGQGDDIRNVSSIEIKFEKTA